MTHSDGWRTGIAILLSLLLHAVAVGAFALFGFDLAPYPETTPVVVTLPEYDEPEPVEPEPQDTEPQDTEQVQASQSERTPAEPAQPGPAAGDRARVDRTAATQPAAQQSSRQGSDSSTATASAEPSPQSSALDAEARAAAREQQRLSDDELFGSDQSDEPISDLPGWALAEEILERPAAQPAASEEEQAELARQVSSLPDGFVRTLQDLQRALDRDPGAVVRPPTAPGDESANDASPSGDVSDNDFIQWFGGGERAAVSVDPPVLAASDFGGQVPAVVSYVIVFEVDERGLVVPGSLILTRSSGYTRADQKVRTAVQGWRFEPAPGASNVTAIATLQIMRDEIE